MGNQSAGNVGGGNEGQTDQGRGSKMKFTYTKSGRKTGQVSGGTGSAPNSDTVDGNKRVVSDPRLS